MDWPALESGEFVLDDTDELLWRQVHPQWVDGGVISSQAFKPNSGDGGQMSVSRESKQTAQGAFEFHTRDARLQSAGTWAVTLGEVHSQNYRAVDDSDSLLGATLSPGHAYIDTRIHGSSKQRKAAGALSRLATARGRIYPTD